MGLYLSTQLDWESSETGWALPQTQRNAEALYSLYFELSVMYADWYQQQDLSFPDNNDGKTETAMLLTTPFRTPLRFVSTVDVSGLAGGVHSQTRLHALMIQQRRSEELAIDKSEYIEANTSKCHVHRRERHAKRGSIAGLESTDAVLTLWSRLPDSFWMLYKLSDSAVAMSSVEKVYVRPDDSTRVSGEPASISGFSKPETTAAYTLADDAGDNYAVTAWTLQHAIHHVAFVISLGHPEMMLTPSLTAPVNSIEAIQAVRHSLSRAYLFMDKDHMSFPFVGVQALHDLLIKEVSRVVESLVNSGATQRGEGMSVDSAIAKAWQKAVIGRPVEAHQVTTSDTAKSALLRKRVSAARLNLDDSHEEETVEDPINTLTAIALQQLNTVLVDPNSMQAEGVNNPSVKHSLEARKSQAVRQRKRSDLKETSTRGREKHTTFVEGGDSESNRSFGLQSSPPTPENGFRQPFEVDVPISAEAPPELEDSEEHESEHSRSDKSEMQQPAPPSYRDRRKTPPAMMDVTGDLRALAPSEIASALLTQNQREEFEDVSEAERATELAKWQRHAEGAPKGLLSEALGKPSLSSYLSRNEQSQRRQTWETANMPDAECSATTEHRRRQRNADKAVHDHNEWEKTCNEDSDDDDFRQFEPRHSKFNQLMFHQVGVSSTNTLMVRSGPAVPIGIKRTFTSAATKISVDKLSAVQRLVFTMVWQKVESTLLTSICLAQQALRGALTLPTAEREIAVLETFVDVDTSPLHSLVREVDLVPWRVVSGELLLVHCTLEDGIIKAKATNLGWALLSCTNNMPHRGITSAPPPASVLGKDSGNELGIKSSAYYCSLAVLLGEHSEAFRKFDIAGYAAKVEKKREVESPTTQPFAPTKPFTVGKGVRRKSRMPSVPTVPSMRNLRYRKKNKSVPQQLKEAFTERERRKKEVVMSLKKYQATAVCKDDDISSGSSEGEDLSGGVSILDYGPERRFIQKTTEVMHVTKALQTFMSPEKETNPTEAKKPTPEYGSSSDDSDYRETVSGVLRRLPTSVRNYNAFVSDDLFSHFVVSDLMAHGLLQETTHANASMLPLEDEAVIESLQFIPGIAPSSLKKADSTLAPQWVLFLQPHVRPARTLFALRCMLEADLSIPANQAALFRNNGFASLANIVSRKADTRLKVCAGRALLVCLQNVAAAKIMSSDVIPKLITAFVSTENPAPPRKPSKDKFKKALKSGHLAKLATEVATSPTIKQGEEAQCGHKEFVTVVGFCLASLAMTVARAKTAQRQGDIEAHAVKLLERYHKVPATEAVRVCLLLLLRALAVKPKLKGKRGRKVPKTPPNLATQLVQILKSKPSSREVQALCGVVCSRAYDTNLLQILADANAVKYLLKPLEDTQTALSRSDLNLCSNSPQTTHFAGAFHAPRSPMMPSHITPPVRSEREQESQELFLCNFFTYIAVIFAIEVCARTEGSANLITGTAFEHIVAVQLALAKQVLGDEEMKQPTSDTKVLSSFASLGGLLLEKGQSEDCLDRYVYPLMLLSGLTGVLANIMLHDGAYRMYLAGDQNLVTTMCKLVTLEAPALASSSPPKVTRILVSVKSKAALFVAQVSWLDRRHPILSRYSFSFLKEIHLSDVPSVAASLCKALRYASSDLEIRSFLLQKGNLGVLWQSLQSISPSVRREAAHCLAALIHPGEENHATAGLPCDKLTEGFLSCLGDRLQLLVRYLDVEDSINALVDTHNYHEVQVALCDVIAHVSHFTNAQGLLETQGLLPIILRLCKENKSKALLASAAHCLWLCAETVPKRVAEDGALQVLADKLCDGNPKADLYIVLTVKVLVTTQPLSYVACIQTGLVGFLVQLLGSTDPLLQANVAAALSMIRRSQQAKARHRASLKTQGG